MANSNLTPELSEAIEMLPENVLASEPFVTFEQAVTRFEADPTASDLMRKLTQAQSDLRLRQSSGSLSLAKRTASCLNSREYVLRSLAMTHLQVTGYSLFRVSTKPGQVQISARRRASSPRSTRAGVCSTPSSSSVPRTTNTHSHGSLHSTTSLQPAQ